MNPTAPPVNLGREGSETGRNFFRAFSTTSRPSRTSRPSAIFSTVCPCSTTSTWRPVWRITARGLKPTKEKRPRCSPPSTDSNRKDSLRPRSLEYADRGVSKSASRRRVTGTRFPWPARRVNSSRLGEYMVLVAGHAPIADQREQSIYGNGEGIAHDAHADAQRDFLFETTKKDKRSAQRAGERGLRKETEEEQARRRFIEPLDKPMTVIVLPMRAHEPGVLEVARGDQHTGGADNNGDERPARKADAEEQVDRDAPLPAQPAGDGVGLQDEVGRGNPGAQKIHAAREEQEGQEDHILRAAKENGAVHHFFE